MKETILTLVCALVFCGVCAGLILLRRRGLSARAREILLGLVAEAEAFFGAGTGEIKFSSVLGKLYAALPKTVQLLFSQKTVASWIEDAVAAFKAGLRNGEDEGV